MSAPFAHSSQPCYSVYVATMYAKCIISEYSLPDDEKSIRPIVAFGTVVKFASFIDRCAPGRQKFFTQGVLFKLASDFPIPDGKGQTIWMFGGSSPSDGTRGERALS